MSELAQLGDEHVERVHECEPEVRLRRIRCVHPSDVRPTRPMARNARDVDGYA